MFENSNKEVIREIARETMKNHKMRNLIAVLAIGLTTLLFTTVFTVGVSFYETLENGTDITPSPMTDGGVITELSDYEQICNDDRVQWAVYARPCNVGSLHNRESVGITASLFSVQQEYYEKNKVVLAEGKFPESADEIVISDTMAKRLTPEGRTGASLTIRPVVREDGELKEKEFTLTISGICTSPLRAIASVYEELYVSEAFLEQKLPGMLSEPAYIFVKTTKKSQSQANGVIADIREQVNGSGVVFRTPNPVGAGSFLAILALALVIMFSGYLLIYNVFYISIVNDIRFYGMLKTIGTTGRQVRSLLTWQVARLTALGIVIGVISGFGVGIFASDYVLSLTEYHDFYEVSVNPLIFLSAIIFSILTVAVSCRKSYALAMKISPIEAAGFRDSRRNRKNVLTALSFALSGIIFLTAFTLPFSYDIEKIVERYNVADVRITQTAMFWGSEEAYRPIEQSMLHQIRGLSCVKGMNLYYQARDFEQDELGRYSDGKGQLKPTEELEKELIRFDAMDTGRMLRADNGDIRLSIWGMPAGELHREEENIRVLEGSLDEEKFATGRYVIYNQGTYQTGKPNETIRAGQELRLSILNPETGRYVDREAEVLAVVERINPFPTGLLSDATLAFPDTVFQEIYPRYGELITVVDIDGKKELTGEEDKAVRDAAAASYNSQLRLTSRYETRMDSISEKASMTLIGVFLSLVFGLIGTCNVVNTLVTGVLSRKIEYATMQSVGMTKRQMCAEIASDALKLCSISLLLAVPAGFFVSRAAAVGFYFLSGFSMPAFALACVILAALMCLLCVGTAAALTAFLNRRPVVERLREAE